MATKPVEVKIVVNVEGDQKVEVLGTQLSDTAEAAQALGDQSTGAASGLNNLAGGAGAAADDVSALGDALGDTADAAGTLGEQSSGATGGLGDLSGSAGAAADDASALGDALGDTADAAGTLGEQSTGVAGGLGDLAGGAGTAADDASALGDALGDTADAAGALDEQSAGAAGGLGDLSSSAESGAADAKNLGDVLAGAATAASDLSDQSDINAGALDDANKVTGDLTDSAGNLQEGLEAVSEQLTTVSAALLAFISIDNLVESAKDVGALADEWKNMGARLQLALGPQTAINKAIEDTYGVSQRTYSSLGATAELYGKISTIGKDMGVSQQQALRLTESINQSVQLSGASAQASEAAIQQLIQGLQSGVVRGDEFNSIMEQSPRLAQALADGLNVPIGTLRSLAEQGKLTASEVIRALTNQSETIEKEFGSLPVTIGRAVQNLHTEWQKFVGTLDQSSGASAVAVAGIQGLTKHLDDVARIATEAGSVMVASFAVQAVQSLRAAIVEMQATGGAAVLLQRDLATLSKPVTIVIAAVGLEVGYQVGTMLRENFVLVRQLGVGMVGFTQQIINDLSFLKDAAAAVFSDDTVGAAFDRYKQRNIEIAASINEMFKDAQKAPGEIASAADKAAQSTAGVGDAAATAAQKMAYAGTAGAASMGQIGSAAETGRAALEALAAQINTRPAADNGITQIIGNLTAAKLRADDVDKVLRKDLPDAISKLSGPELVKFRSEFLAAMDAAGLKGKELQSGLRLIAEQAAQSLGVDVPLATNKITKEFEAARGNLSVLIRSLPDLKAAGVDTASVVAQAMVKMIDGAKSKAEIDAVTRQVNVLRKELGDKLADSLLDQAADKATALGDALDKAKPGINSLREALAELGLKSRDDLVQTAAKAQEAFAVITKAGQAEGESYAAWQKRKSAAAEVMLTRMIESNSGVATEAIKTRAAMEGLEVQTDSTGKATVRAAAEAVKSIDGLGDAYTRAGQAAESAADAAVSALERQTAAAKRSREAKEAAADEENKRLNRDSNGFALDKTGKQTVNQGVETWMSIMEQLKTYGVDDAAARKLAYEFTPDGGKVAPYSASAAQKQYGGEFGTLGYAIQQAAQQYLQANPPASGTQSPVAPAAAAVSAQTKTYKVDLTIAGQLNSFNMASDTDAQNLIKALQSAQRTAS